MTRKSLLAGAGALAAIGLAFTATAASAQASGSGGGSPPPGPRSAGLGAEQEAQLAQKHDGYYGSLAPENLKNCAKRKVPFDLTGTWFINLRHSFADFMFGPPYPEFYAAGQQAMKEAEEARKAGKPYRDSIGECYPAGVPMIETRVWPVGMIQLPTVIWITYAFTNSYRAIYLDDRKFTDPDIAVYTYNGESIGHWEGNKLVVHAKYFETNKHYIDMGIPIDDKFEMTEIYSMPDKETLQIDAIMTDPTMWKGEWKSTHRWIRQHYSDVPEVECLPNLNAHLPSTEEGQAAIKAREEEKAPGK